jgi:DmsE family decaheme c-type cytochrome
MLKRLILSAAGLVLMIGCAQVMEQRANFIRPPEVAPGATYVGSEACYGCHDILAGDRRNVHMRIASFEVPGGYKTGCEGCHGPGSLHVEGEGDTAKILLFGENGLEADQVAGVCTTCHQIGRQLNWSGSAHAQNDVSCTSCHRIHKNGNAHLLSAREKDVCAACHQDVNAQTYLASHHPLKEGKMGCSDCHNPHGSSSFDRGMLKTDERVNDLCLKCHTRYQGPFVFEHDPVIEDCLICHESHGSVANNLLRQQEPFLCLQCHEAHFHGARASNDMEAHGVPGGNPSDPSRQIQPVNFGFQKSFFTKCTQCHSQVHGSDLPAQSVTGAGGALTR